MVIDACQHPGCEDMTALVDRFKTAFRTQPAGVAIAVCSTSHGPAGLTVSSVVSVSARPPLLAFSVSRHASSAADFASCSALDIVMLNAHQAELAINFATRGASRFTTDQGWVERAEFTTMPSLKSARATLPAGPRPLPLHCRRRPDGSPTPIRAGRAFGSASTPDRSPPGCSAPRAAGR